MIGWTRRRRIQQFDERLSRRRNGQDALLDEPSEQQLSPYEELAQAKRVADAYHRSWIYGGIDRRRHKQAIEALGDAYRRALASITPRGTKT